MSHWGATDFGEFISVLLPCVVLADTLSAISRGHIKGKDTKPNGPQEFAVLRTLCVVLKKKKKKRGKKRVITVQETCYKKGTDCAGRIDYI